MTFVAISSLFHKCRGKVTIGGVTSTLASFPEVIRQNVWESLLDVMLLSNIPGPSLWLQKRSACEEGDAAATAQFFHFWECAWPLGRTERFCGVGWAQEGRETCCRIGKNVLLREGKRFVEVRGKGCRRGNEILHDCVRVSFPDVKEPRWANMLHSEHVWSSTEHALPMTLGKKCRRSNNIENSTGECSRLSPKVGELSMRAHPCMDLCIKCGSQ